MRQLSIVLIVLLVIPSIQALPDHGSIQLRHRQLSEGVVPNKCESKTATECLADKCCDWCGVYFNATVGFCMPTLPTPSPALVCQRDPVTCGAQSSPSTCGDAGSCKWVPAGMPGAAAGLCVYDWDVCKPAPSVHIQTLKPIRAAAAETAASSSSSSSSSSAGPRLSCNMTSQSACDARACCQWCGPAVGAGFCMPVVEWPMPALTCSKAGSTCSGLAGAAACETSPMCSWHPFFGPPGAAAGPGVCAFDAVKCAAT